MCEGAAGRGTAGVQPGRAAATAAAIGATSSKPAAVLTTQAVKPTAAPAASSASELFMLISSRSVFAHRGRTGRR